MTLVECLRGAGSLDGAGGGTKEGEGVKEEGTLVGGGEGEMKGGGGVWSEEGVGAGGWISSKKVGVGSDT